MQNGIIIYLSIIIGAILLLGGSYITIENLINPQGLLFEGIVGLSLGIILLMIIVVASTIGKTIMIFSEILDQTTNLNKQISQVKTPPQNLFNGVIPIHFTNLDTGETKTTSINPENTEDFINKINKINDKMLSKLIHDTQGKNKTSLQYLSNLELEKKLADAIKVDNFEEAAKINAILKSRKDSDDNKKDSENSSE